MSSNGLISRYKRFTKQTGYRTVVRQDGTVDDEITSTVNVLIYRNLHIHFVPALGCFEMSTPFCGDILAQWVV